MNFINLNKQMKKILFLLAGIVILGVSSCKKEYIEKKYYTYAVPNKTIYADRVAADWTEYDAGKTYTTTIPIYADDNYYNEYDGVLLFVSFDNGTTYDQVSSNYNGISYSFAVTDSEIFISVQSANFDTAITPPAFVKFKVILVPSEA